MLALILHGKLSTQRFLWSHLFHFLYNMFLCTPKFVAIF